MTTVTKNPKKVERGKKAYETHLKTIKEGILSSTPSSGDLIPSSAPGGSDLTTTATPASTTATTTATPTATHSTPFYH